MGVGTAPHESHSGASTSPTFHPDLPTDLGRKLGPSLHDNNLCSGMQCRGLWGSRSTVWQSTTVSTRVLVCQDLMWPCVALVPSHLLTGLTFTFCADANADGADAYVMEKATMDTCRGHAAPNNGGKCPADYYLAG